MLPRIFTSPTLNRAAAKTPQLEKELKKLKEMENVLNKLIDNMHNIQKNYLYELISYLTVAATIDFSAKKFVITSEGLEDYIQRYLLGSTSFLGDERMGFTAKLATEIANYLQEICTRSDSSKLTYIPKAQVLIHKLETDIQVTNTTALLKQIKRLVMEGFQAINEGLGTVKEMIIILAGTTLIRNTLNLKKVNLLEVWLPRIDLSYTTLEDSYLKQADLEKANLTGANLKGANLTKANLTKANLTKANLTNADLRGAILINADLSGTNLTNTDLRGADLRGAKLSKKTITTGVKLNGTKLDKKHLTLLEKLNLVEADGENTCFIHYA